MSNLPTWIDKFTILIKHNLNQNILGNFCRYQQFDSKMYRENKRTRIAKSIFKNMYRVRGLTLSDFNTYYIKLLKSRKYGIGERTDK